MKDEITGGGAAPWGQGRMLNALWWSTAGLLVLWGRASKWSLQPTVIEFITSAIIWTICAILVTEVLSVAGRKVRLLEHSLPRQMLFGSIGHIVGTVMLVGLLFGMSHFEPFTETCLTTRIDWQDVQAACNLDAQSQSCTVLTRCFGYGAQASDAGMLLIVGLLVTAWIPTASSIAHLFRTQRIETEAVNARTALAEARLQSVRHQVNSHLVFNALNSILAAIEDQSDRAGEMVIDLSELLRNSLDAAPSEYSLGKEGERLCLYLRIEKSRFEDDLAVSYRMPESLRSLRCLPMTIQPLVENAIKHGFRSGAVPLSVFVDAVIDGGFVRVSVTNSGRLGASTFDEHLVASGAEQDRAGTGLGLGLLKQRLEAAYGDDWLLELVEEHEGDKVSVRATVAWPAEEVERNIQ